MSRAVPRCPLRAGDPCSLCNPGASGPQDCPSVYLALGDPELMEAYRASVAAAKQKKDAAA